MYDSGGGALIFHGAHGKSQMKIIPDEDFHKNQLNDKNYFLFITQNKSLIVCCIVYVCFSYYIASPTEFFDWWYS